VLTLTNAATRLWGLPSHNFNVVLDDTAGPPAAGNVAQRNGIDSCYVGQLGPFSQPG
jgi:hypothetical protein